MGWLYEFVGTIFFMFSPLLNHLGIGKLYYTDVVLYFVVIPCVHLMNNEDTKIIIRNGSWYQGIRHILGIATTVVPIHTDNSWLVSKKSENPITSKKLRSESLQSTRSFHMEIPIRRYSSAPNFYSPPHLLLFTERKNIQSCSLLRELSSTQVIIQDKENK